ncbi:unnamed protein product [Rotaria sp. Silwood1]|nr:unnamed protein product [Rotaria sp. Silwood1]CAF4930299.1 unnamed protein product [Rotaria sp. Silwood1]
MPAANLLPVAGNQVSDFYLACRNGDINAVKRMLCDKKRVNINRMEPNGSTALHAASYFGLKRGNPTCIMTIVFRRTGTVIGCIPVLLPYRIVLIRSYVYWSR